MIISLISINRMNNIFNDSILVVLLALYTKYSVLFFTKIYLRTYFDALRAKPGKDLYKV